MSYKIEQLLETTQSWLKTETIEPEAEEQFIIADTSQENFIEDRNGVEAGLTPELIRF